METLKLEAEHKERQLEFESVAKIRYSQIPALEKEISTIESSMLALKQSGTSTIREKVESSDIATVVSKWTGIPAGKLVESDRARILELFDRLSNRVLGQDVPLHKIADAIARNKVGLGDPKRPIGSFLLLGPTGVGKTETAKALAEELFIDADAMIRIDMGEYSESHSVARLIGAPPGYVGYDEGGQLTEAVRRKPYSVILFDEIEKAHPDVFKVFLEILDEGHLTDGKGRRVNFKNTIILMTSNAVSHVPENTSRSDLQKELLHYFRPELLGRIDEIVFYNPLDEFLIRLIAEKELTTLRTRLAEEGYEVAFSRTLIETLIKEGFDPEFGARPMRRAVNEFVANPLATKILSGEIIP
ncbi:MAG: AAA family ATPase [Patescibacteria group bacterium]